MTLTYNQMATLRALNAYCGTNPQVVCTAREIHRSQTVLAELKRQGYAETPAKSKAHFCITEAGREEVARYLESMAREHAQIAALLKKAEAIEKGVANG